MKYRLKCLLAAGAIVGAAFPVLAHHGTTVTYITGKTIVVEGTVTEWVFGFPHSQIYFDVTGADGKVAHWGTELGPTPSMMKALNIGWTRESIKPGDKITLTCSPHRVPGSTACLSRQIVINGKLMPLNAEQVRKGAAGAGAAAE